MAQASTRRAVRAVLLAALWCASTVLAGAHDGDFDLRGTVRVAVHPEPDAVVWLEAPNGPPSPSGKPIVLDQRNFTFFPHVLAVRVGTTVDLPNNDRVFHNVFSFHDGKRFDLGLFPVGTSRPVRFDKPGVNRVFCNIHPNMAIRRTSRCRIATGGSRSPRFHKGPIPTMRGGRVERN
ncbi:MAG: hypothetical protein DMG00_04090 [Acidobacteria bacterium]|nr:MAG: hypothetical protein DMG00_04090 [Acidobacteriota bacterium]